MVPTQNTLQLAENQTGQTVYPPYTKKPLEATLFSNLIDKFGTQIARFE
jgi:hypothetical protein